MPFLMAIWRFAAGAFAAGAAAVAILAFLGFALPELDLLNHLQVFIFIATIAGLVLTLTAFREGRARLVLTVFGATGFILSATVVVPEIVAGLTPRPALPTDGRPVLKAMTLNIFGLNYDMARVSAYIAAEEPDIIALQEYFADQRVPLHPMLIGAYPYFATCAGGKRANIALYAKRPFTRTESGACREAATPLQRTSRILASFMLDDGTLFSLLTTHLDWPLPAARQKMQMDELATAIARIPGPVIVIGDLNSTPWSYALRGLVADSGVTRHTANIVTYPLAITVPDRISHDNLLPLFPFLPLDHVMSRGGIAVHELHTGPDVGSDHLPVVFTFSVQPPTECCAAPPG